MSCLRKKFIAFKLARTLRSSNRYVKARFNPLLTPAAQEVRFHRLRAGGLSRACVRMRVCVFVSRAHMLQWRPPGGCRAVAA